LREAENRVLGREREYMGHEEIGGSIIVRSVVTCTSHYYSNVITKQQFRQTQYNVTLRLVCVTIIVMEKANTRFVSTVDINITANNIQTLSIEQRFFYGDFTSRATIKRT
jgi:hypothetical protein